MFFFEVHPTGKYVHIHIKKYIQSAIKKSTVY